MKKFILSMALAFCIAGALSAQAGGSSIGLRLGYPTELSYQKGLSDANRIELGLGFRSYGYNYGYTGNYVQFSLSGVYQWVWNLDNVTTGLNWYAGVGASVAYYSYYGYSGLPVSILGQVGVEYNFNFPLRVSLDYRPGFQITNGAGFIYDGIALGLRYKF